MKQPQVKILALLLCAAIILPVPSGVFASEPGDMVDVAQDEGVLHAYADETGDFVLPAAQPFALELETPSYILMEAETGRVLCEKNPDIPLPPASVTKIMTLLLVMEALENGSIKLTDMVPVSEDAASKGGSQIYLEVGEEMTVEVMIKAVVISSANDASVALAELVAGSEQAFVERMNKRAQELGMTNTHFENCTGLDDTVTNLVSARDIAIMSRELLKHKKILDYTTI